MAVLFFHISSSTDGTTVVERFFKLTDDVQVEEEAGLGLGRHLTLVVAGVVGPHLR